MTEKPAPKVTMRDKPAATAVDATTAEVTDDRGRVLKVRKINALMRYDLSMLIGSQHIDNAGVMGPASLACSVAEIDGVVVFPPATNQELRALIQRLDDEGIAAVAKAYVDAGWIEPEIDKAALKN